MSDTNTTYDAVEAQDYLARELPSTQFDHGGDDRRRKRAIHTLYRYAKDRVVPSLRIGRRIYFRKADLDAWIAAGGKGFEHGWRR